MSKPNLLAFSSSVGIYRNKRMRDLRLALGKSVPKKIEFRELAPMLFQAVMAYAGENQIDGNFADYSTDDWCEIFAVNHVQLSAKEAAAIIKGFEQVGLFDHGKIRSWMKYNRHLADYENIVKQKRKAGKILQQKRLAALKNGDQNGAHSPENPDEEPGKNGAESDSPSKQLWLIEKALENAKGKARKELLEQKRKLLEGATGTDLSNPAPAPARSKPAKEKPPTDDDLLTGAEYLVSIGQTHLLTRSQCELLARRKKEDGQNPVPG